jgi:hypothetical protein
MMDFLVILLVFVLAAFLGYFFKKAMISEKLRQLNDDIQDFNSTKDQLAKTERTLAITTQEKQNIEEKEESVRNNFYRLTLNYKSLQDELKVEKKRASVPDVNKLILTRINESNRILVKEIRKTRVKLKKCRNSDLMIENQILHKKLKKVNKKLSKKLSKSLSVEDRKKYQKIYRQIQLLGDEVKFIIDKK